MAVIAIVPDVSGLVPAVITAKSTVCRVTVTDAQDNRVPDDTGGSFAYYLLFENPAGDNGKSYAFNVSADGGHVFNNYVFPNSGGWVIRLRDAFDDQDVATLRVSVA